MYDFDTEEEKEYITHLAEWKMIRVYGIGSVVHSVFTINDLWRICFKVVSRVDIINTENTKYFTTLEKVYEYILADRLIWKRRI